MPKTRPLTEAEEARLESLRGELEAIRTPWAQAEQILQEVARILRGEGPSESTVSREDYRRLKPWLEQLVDRNPGALRWQVSLTLRVLLLAASLLADSPDSSEFWEDARDTEEQGLLAHYSLAYLENLDSDPWTPASEAPAKKAKGQRLDLLPEITRLGKRARLKNSLETSILEGAKYKDLLKAAKDSSLQEQDQQEAIAQAITAGYSLRTVAGLTRDPGLRQVAEDLEAPYAVVIGAYSQKAERQ